MRAGALWALAAAALLLGPAEVAPSAPTVTSVSPRRFFFNAEPTLLVRGSGFDPTATGARCVFTYSWMGTKFAAIERGQRCNNSANGLGDAQPQGLDEHGQRLCEVPLYSAAEIVNETTARCAAPRFSFPMYEQNLRNVLDIEQGLETLVAVGIANDGRNFSLSAAALAADRGAVTALGEPWVVSTFPLLSAELDRRPYTSEIQPAHLVFKLHGSLLGRELSLSASCGGQQILAPRLLNVTTAGLQPVSVPLDLGAAWAAWTARGTPSPGTGYGGSTCTGNGTGCTPDAQSNLWECIGTASLVDHSAGGKLLQSEPIHLALAHGSRPNQVTISHSRRSIMVDDEPFLPVGWFFGNEDIDSEGGRGLQATVDYMESLAEQGVNMLMLYGTGWQGTPVPLDPDDLNKTLALLDAAWGVGVRVQLCMPGLAGIFRVDSYTPYSPRVNRSSTFEALDAYIAAVSTKPALLGYYIGDDTMGYDTKQLNATYRYIRRRDPWHLCFTAITAASRAWSYKYWYDIAMVESYSGAHPAGTGQTTQILSAYPLDFEPSIVCPDGHGIAEGTLEIWLSHAQGGHGILIFMNTPSTPLALETAQNYVMGNQLHEISDAIGADKVNSAQPAVAVSQLQNASMRIYGQQQVVATAWRDASGTLTVLASNVDLQPQTAVTFELTLHTTTGDVNQSDLWAYLPFHHAPVVPRGGRGTGTRKVPIARQTARGSGASTDEIVYTWSDHVAGWESNVYRINETWAGLQTAATNLAIDPSFEAPPAVAGFPGSAGFPLDYWQLAETPDFNGFGSGWSKVATARTVVGSSVTGRHSLEIHIPQRYRSTMGLLMGLKGGGLTASVRYHLSFFARTTAVESGCVLAVSIAARNASHRSSSKDIFSSFPIEQTNSTIALTTSFEQHSVTFTAPPLPWQDIVPYFHSLDCASYRLDDAVLSLQQHQRGVLRLKTDDSPPPVVSSVLPDRCPTVPGLADVLQISGQGFEVSATNATCKITGNYWGWGFNEIRTTKATVISSSLVRCQCPLMTGFNGTAELAGNVTLSVCFAGVANCTNDGFDAPTLLSYYKVLSATVSRRPLTHEDHARLLLNIDMPAHQNHTLFVRGYAEGWTLGASAVARGRSSVPLPLPQAPFNEMLNITLHGSSDPTSPVLAHTETRLIRLAEATHNEVKIDYESRSLTVRGQPFFGSGWFVGAGSTPDHLQTLSSRGINYVIGYGLWSMSQPQADVYLDSAAATGLNVVFDVYALCYMLIGSTHGAGPMEYDQEKWAHLSGLVTRYANHSALLGWYTADDTTFYYRDNMRLLYSHIKQLDPHHPQFVTLSGYDGAYIYSECFDIGMPEEYGAEVHTAFMHRFLYKTIICQDRVGTNTRKIEQGAFCADELHGIGPIGDTMRPLHIMQQFPNKWEPLWLCGQGFQPIWSRELMAQFWLSVIQGGTGVGWFFDSVETHTSRWRLISESGQVALAIEDISRAVVANSSAVQQFTTQVNTTSGLLAAAFEEEETGCVFVIVLNMGRPQLAEIRLPEITSLTNVTTPYERGRALALKGGVIDPPESIDAMQSRVYQVHHGNGCPCTSAACAKATAGIPPSAFTSHRRGSLAPPPPLPKNQIQNAGCEESVDAGQCDWWLFVVDAAGLTDEHAQLFSSTTYRVTGRHSLKIVSPMRRDRMHVPWPGGAIKATSEYSVSFWARSDTIGQVVSLLNYNASCLPRSACVCGGNYTGCGHSYTQFSDTPIANVTLSSEWKQFSWVLHGLNGVVGIELTGVAYFDDFTVTDETLDHNIHHHASSITAMKSDDDVSGADPPVNYVVADVTPRRCPVGGIGVDGKPEMLMLTGSNFSSIPRDNNGSSAAFCWAAESWCGWHFTLVHNYLNTNATILNDTHVQCPCPLYDFGGRIALSLKTDPVPAVHQLAAPPPQRTQQRQIPWPEPPGFGSGPEYGSYDVDDASCALDPAAADALSFRVQGGPFPTQASASIDYFPLLSIAPRYYPFTSANQGEILVRTAPELSAASDLHVTIVLTVANGWYWNGTNSTLVTAAEVVAGETTAIQFDLTQLKTRTLGNITATLSGVAFGTERIVLARSSNRFLFAGPPIPSQVIMDHGAGTLLGDGGVKLSGSGWYQGWVQWGPARMRLVANQGAFEGETATMATGMPGFIELPGATENNGRTILNQTLLDRMATINLEHVNETVAFIRHCYSIGLWVIADIPATWGLSGILHEKDCTGCEGKSNVDPVFGNHTNMQMAQRMVEAMMHEPGLLGYNTWGLYFSWTAYESYKWLKSIDPYHPLNSGVAPGNGAIMNWATADQVNPEDYYGAQGVAASQRELQAYPCDWAIAADYGAGEGSDDGGMYVNHWAQMMYGSFFNYWFIESGGPTRGGIKADANKAGFEGRALMPSIWSARLHPELQPTLQVHPAAQLTANAWAEPCVGPHNPCGNFGTDVPSPQGQVRWPPPQFSAGCLIHAVVVNGGPYAVPLWNATVQIPVQCHCPAHVNASYLFRGKDEAAGSGPPILLNLTAQSDRLLVTSFTEHNIAAYGSAILQINCSAVAGERTGHGDRETATVPNERTKDKAGQLIVNPSFELDLRLRPELVGSLCSDAPTMWGGPDGTGTGTLESPVNPAMPAWTLPESTGYPTIRPEFGLSSSGRSSAKVMNTDVEHARVCVSLAHGANATLPPGLIAGHQYTVQLWSRVAPSTLPMRLTIAAKDARCQNGCIATNSSVLASGSAGGGKFTAIRATFIAPVNSTTLYVQQHGLGTLWLDDFTVVEA